MKNKFKSFRIRSVLFSLVAASAVLFESPPTWFWLYEPEKPACFKKK